MTIKQETFCQKYIETGNASEAYRQAYRATAMKPATVAVKASELLHSGKVAVRVAELRGAAVKAHGVTVASLIAELEEARQVGAKREQASAMVQATLGKAKLAGLDKEAGEEGDEAVPVSVTVEVQSGRKRADA